MKSIREIATPSQKAKLRKVKTLSSKVKSIVFASALTDVGHTAQFHSDLALYGLWEALLYVEGYEPKHYPTGTAMRAFLAAI